MLMEIILMYIYLKLRYKITTSIDSKLLVWTLRFGKTLYYCLNPRMRDNVYIIL